MTSIWRLLVIVGPTASGKSALAHRIAKEFNGEIISADSRTIYKDMDIGTAKPSAKERAEVPYWGLDLVEPNKYYNVAMFKKYAEQKIGEIQNRGKLPIMVGGSGLYIDSVLFDYQFSQSNAQRDEQNPRHLKKQEETRLGKIRPNTLVVGLNIDGEKLKNKINKRVEEMISSGFIEEVKKVSEKYGWDSPALLAPGYRAFTEYLDGSLNLKQAKELFIQNDLNLAKRQRTWFRRNEYIKWFADIKTAEIFLAGELLSTKKSK